MITSFVTKNLCLFFVIVSSLSLPTPVHVSLYSLISFGSYLMTFILGYIRKGSTRVGWGEVGWRCNAELQAKQREYRNGSRCSLTRPRMTKKPILVRFFCIHITELYEIQRQQMSLCACCYYQEIKLFNSQMNFRLSLFVFLHPPHRALRNIDRTQLRLNTQLKINRENICLHIIFATTQSLYDFLNK